MPDVVIFRPKSRAMYIIAAGYVAENMVSMKRGLEIIVLLMAAWLSALTKPGPFLPTLAQRMPHRLRKISVLFGSHFGKLMGKGVHHPPTGRY